MHSPNPFRPTSSLLRVAGWNAVLIGVGILAILIVGEIYYRLTVPFTRSSLSMQFVPPVGFVIEPHAEVAWTNGLDFWAVSRTNSLGFLDREPISPEQAARSCHISMIGDSFVAAFEVPIADKFHVRLEALAAREMPHLDVTTSAFGIMGTGQVAQLPLYDEYARRLSPKLVVLLFIQNDLSDNSRLLSVLTKGWGPDRVPYFHTKRSPDGRVKLMSPSPNSEWNIVLRDLQPPQDKLLFWLERMGGPTIFPSEVTGPVAHMEALKNLYPQYRDAFGDWQPRDDNLWSVELAHEFFVDDPPPVFKDAVDFTAFALDQFKQRAARDGFALLILLPHQLWDIRMRALVTSLATDREIPIVSLEDYLASRGIAPQEAQWLHDGHWNPAGHQWAAETLLEYLEHNPSICTG